MLALLWIEGLLRRRWVRVVGMTVCVALAVALFASLGAFITTSNVSMTQRAITGVPVDWQVELKPGTEAGTAIKTISSATGAKLVRETGFAEITAFTAKTGATVQTTGAGKALGLPADYAKSFPGEVRYLAGAHEGVLLAQQTAANLHVGVGDTIQLSSPGGTLTSLAVDGIIDLPNADSLFQIVGAPPGAGATAPPDNVVVLPLDQWHALFDGVASFRPDAVRTQVHLKVAQGLPTNPSAAYSQIVARAHNLEAGLAGAGTVGNNLAATLDAARKDAVYSELLFLFLGLPGVVLAWLLAASAGASGHERRRREQALLRTRGASPARIVRLAAAEAALVGLLGTAIGLGAAYVADRYVLAGGAMATSGAIVAWAAAAAVLGFVLAASSIVFPAQRDARLLTVRAATAEVGSVTSPLWQRLGVDFVLLAGSGLIFWQSMKDAYQVVLVPEGVPSISINYLTLLAPIMFWIGAALLAWRVGDLMLGRGRKAMSVVMKPIAGRLSRVVTAGMSRQRRMLARSLVLTALAVSFAISVAVFNTTYAAQARVDAELSNGADVSLTSGSTGLPPSAVANVRGIPGVQEAQPMQHRLGYVGNDLQDLYGIDPAAIGRATPMSDAYFQGGSARQILDALAAAPDGILVSDETVKDFQLQPGDTVKIRVQFASDRAYHEVPFRYVGVAREFPTAPHDSFLVANAAYISKMTGSPTFETLLVKTTPSASPAGVATAARGLFGPASGVKVTDVTTELRATLSGLTAIDLSGLTKLELVFAVVMAIMASGLMLVLGFAERRRSFAIAHALGATTRQLAAFVWSEAAFVTLGGAVLGVLSGWLEAAMIVKILTGVFDPPPEALSVPWVYLTGVAATVVLSIVVAGAVAINAARRPALSVIRDL